MKLLDTQSNTLLHFCQTTANLFTVPWEIVTETSVKHAAYKLDSHWTCKGIHNSSCKGYLILKLL